METDYLGAAYITTAASSNWKVVGAADFDANTTPDILWHDQTSAAWWSGL